ncbi:TPA: 4-hydroxy-tetrahydrodipicolinate synthase [Candidatus Poribacteria bacterium]|nr:4-hydroxy-tetrahydrodipicolinate synthase [Candidatus Poribacteria bacterium]
MAKRSLKVEGIIPALATPMNDDESINENGLKKLIDFVIKGGVHGIFVSGSQGESFSMTIDEKKRVIATSIEASDGRVPIYAGTGTITTSQAVQLTKMARELGADAVSVTTPYFIKPSQKELIDYYKAVSDVAEDMPVLLYSNPMRTGVIIEVDTVVKLSELDNVVGMKDSSGDIVQTSSYIEATKDKDFSILVGNDACIFSALVSGAKGAVAATANVAPRLIVDLYNAVKAGNIDLARDLQYKLLPIRKAFTMGTFPVVIKEALNLMGLPAGPARRPIQPLPSGKREELKSIMKKAGLINLGS